MPDSIEQKFSVDASQALAALDKLNNAYLRHEQIIQRLAGTMAKFNGSSNPVANAAKQVGVAFQTNVGQQAVQATERLVVSWGLLSRIVTTQLIVRELNFLRQTLRGAVTDATAFQIKLAEIQTISPGDTIAGLSSQLRQLSDDFNIPALDVAKAKYEAISNGFTEVSEQTDVLTAAFKFSKVAQTDSAASLDVISTTLNAFGKSSSEAEVVAAKLFKTIELGKVTGPELAHALGRVNSIASTTGVSLGEVLAQFSALTIAGVNANEAATQISSTLSSLIKPSDAAAEAFKQMGYSGFEAAQQTLGLQGTIKGLLATTDGSAESIAKIFPNVRALRDVLRVAPNDETLSKFLKEIDSIDVSKFNAILDKRLNLDAEKATSELNKFKNLLLEAGNSLLYTVARTADLTGGVDNLAIGLRGFSPILLTGTAALAAYAVAAYTGATANAAFASSFLGVTGGLLLVAEAVAGGKQIGKALIEAVEGPRKAFDKVIAQQVEEIQKANTKQLAEIESANKRRVEAALRANDKLNQAYTADVENAKHANEALVDNTNKSLDKIVAARQKYVAELGKAGEKARELARDSGGRVDSLNQSKQDRQFQRKIEPLDDTRKSLATSERANELAEKAARALAEAARNGDQFGISRALGLFDKAQSEAEAADVIAKRTGNRNLEFRAAEAVESVTNRQIVAEKQLQAVQAERQKSLLAEQQRQEGIVAQLRAATKIVLDNTSQSDKDGKRLSEQQLAKRAEARNKALGTIAELGFQQTDFKAADALGLIKFASEFRNDLSEKPVNVKFQIDGGIEKIRADLQKAFSDFKQGTPQNESQLEKLLGKEFKNPDDVAAGLGEAQKKVLDLKKGFDQIGVDDQNIQRLKIEILAIGAATDETARKILRMVGGTDSGEVKEIQAIRKELDLLGGTFSGKGVSDKQVTDLFNRVSKLNEGINPLGANIGGQIDTTELVQAVGLLKQLQQLQQQRAANPANAPGAGNLLKDLQGYLNSVDPTSRFESAATAIGQGVGPSQSISTAWESAASAAERVAAASASIATPAPTGSPDGYASGGLVRGFADGGLVPQYLAAGGSALEAFAARGSDTVPAMLTPGEFVMNQKSTGKFYSQLKAMNAGYAPTTINRGPTIDNTNNSVGEITINAASQPTATAREVIQAIRREQRRGSGNSLR